MKTASKVFLILAIIGLGFGLVFSFFGWDLIVRVAMTSPGITIEEINLLNSVGGLMKGIMIASSIVPLVIAIVALVKLNRARYKRELTVIAILSLIFVNLIVGILMLLIKDEDLAY